MCMYICSKITGKNQFFSLFKLVFGLKEQHIVDLMILFDALFHSIVFMSQTFVWFVFCCCRLFMHLHRMHFFETGRVFNKWL